MCVCVCVCVCVFYIYILVDRKATPVRMLLPPVAPLCVVCVAQLLLSVLMIMKHQASLYAVFIILTVFRSFLFEMVMGFIADM